MLSERCPLGKCERDLGALWESGGYTESGGIQKNGSEIHKPRSCHDLKKKLLFGNIVIDKVSPTSR